MHPRIGLKDLVLGKSASVPDFKFHGHVLREGVSNHLVCSSTDYTNKVFGLDSLSHFLNGGVVKFNPMRQGVVKRRKGIVFSF